MKFELLIVIILLFLATGFALNCASISSVLNSDGSINTDIVSQSQIDAAELQVQEINEAIEENNASWTAAVTPVMFVKPILMSERSSVEGLQIEEASKGGFSVKSNLPSASPSELDLRNYNGVNYVTSVKDQGGCGSCWAFSADGASESAFNINLGLYNPQKVTMPFLDLSEQQLVSCSGAGDCINGGYPEDALDYMSIYGTVNESCMPYTATDSDCSDSGCRHYFIKDKIYLGNTIDNAENIKNNLKYYGALVFTNFPVYIDFYSYDSGIYTHEWGAYDGLHAMTLVGFNDTGQYWIVKNSWNTDWGEDGYIKIAYNFGSNARDYVGVYGVTDTDIDGDGVADSTDNCPFISNSNQIDSNNNSVGNACDIFGTLTNPTNLTYSLGKAYTFSVVVNGSYDDVWYSLNGANYTASGNGSNFSFSLVDLPASYNVSYVWYANDTSGNLFNIRGSVITLQSSGVSNLLLNGNSSNILVQYGEGFNVSASGQGNLTVYFNGTVLSNGSYELDIVNQTLAAGYYNVTLFSSGDQNYTSSLKTLFINVTKAVGNTSLLLDGVSSNLTLQYGVVFNFSASGNGLITIYLNGVNRTSSQSPFFAENQTLAAGYYNITAVSSGNQNYTSSRASLFLNITKAPGSTILFLNGNNSSAEIVYGLKFNVSALGQGNVTIYFNGTSTFPHALNVSLTNQTKAVGYYNITAVSSGNQNYTSSNASLFLNITKADSLLNLTVNGASTDLALKQGQTANLLLSMAGPVSFSSIYIDGILNISGITSRNFTLSPGAHIITAVYSGNENYTSTNVTIAVNQTALIVEIISPVNQVYNSSFDLNASVSATLSVEDSCWWSLSNGTVSELMNCSLLNNSKSFANGTYSLTVYANDSIGNLASDTVTFMVSVNSSVFIVNSSNFTVSNETILLLIPAENLVQNITLPPSLQNQSFYLDLTLNLSEGNSTASGNITVFRNSDVANCSLFIQEGTVFSASSWNGTFELPITMQPDNFTAPSGTLDTVISLGFNNGLNLSKPAKIVLSGMKGKTAAWSANNILTKINTVCNSATNPTNINPITARECYANSGNDLVIWTYHFTSFAAYTPKTSSGGGGGGSSGIAPVYCIEGSVKCIADVLQSCINKKTFNVTCDYGCENNSCKAAPIKVEENISVPVDDVKPVEQSNITSESEVVQEEIVSAGGTDNVWSIIAAMALVIAAALFWLLKK